MAELLARFVAAFKRGLEGELAAMHASAEAYEISLSSGEDLGGLRYRFEVGAGERLVAGTVCTLGGQRITIERVEGARVTLLATQPVEVGRPCALVVAPWFLYERLIGALDEIRDAPIALALFGKGERTRRPAALRARCVRRARAARRSRRRPSLSCPSPAAPTRTRRRSRCTAAPPRAGSR